MENLEKIFQDYILLASSEKKLSISSYIVSYISSAFYSFYRDMPLYLIDLYETSLFKMYKRKGDLSLILVGFFNSWVNRANRPLTERDYITSGKQNYFNAYIYLDKNFGKLLKDEWQKDYTKYLSDFQDLNIQIDIFKDLSENFEEYANMLKTMRKLIDENKKLRELFKDIEESL